MRERRHPGAGAAGDAADRPAQPAHPQRRTAALGRRPATGDRGGDPKAVGTLVDLLEVPWGVDFLPDGDAVVTERISGRVLQVTPDGALTRLGTITAAVPEGEAGLLGVAVSPDFDSDRTLFFYLTTGTDNRVLSAPLDGATLGEPTVVLDGIPRGFIHDGGRIAFGPDGYLYVTTGETGDPTLAQDPDSLAGKILRITPDGAPAPGNPDPDSPVWSLGHRNVQGLAWDDEGRLWASEFGDSDFDELNLIEKGGNYGWPQVEGVGGRPGSRRPAAGLAGRAGLAERVGVRRRAPLDGGPPRPAAVADQGLGGREGLASHGVVHRGLRPAAHRGHRPRRPALAHHVQPGRPGPPTPADDRIILDPAVTLNRP